jgi:outer membrane protein assembly factor BamA
VRGALVAKEREYLGKVGVKPGEVFNRGRLAAGIARMVALHRERGHGEPRIEPSTAVDTTARRIDLTFEIAAP